MRAKKVETATGLTNIYDPTIGDLIEYLKNFPATAKVAIAHPVTYKPHKSQIAINHEHQVETNRAWLTLGEQLPGY